MRAKPRNLLIALGAVTALAASALPSDAAILPVGSGAWASNNVSAGPGCVGIGTGSTECLLAAKSNTAAPAPARETCSNASYVVTTPVIIGTNFGCHVEFHATLRLTGTGVEIGNEQEDLGTEIETGACAGLTLSGAYVDVHDAAVGDYRVHPRVTVSPAAWKFQGNLVSVDASTQKVVVLNVAGSIAPGCKRIKARRGETSISFTGVFSGKYTFL